MSERRESAQHFLDLAQEHRGKLTASDRCAALLRNLEPSYLARLPEGGRSGYQFLVDSLHAGDFQNVGGDQALAGFIADADSPLAEGMAPDVVAIFIATAYAVEAIKCERDGRREEAWSLAFDAAQWEGFVSGVTTGGDPAKVREAMSKLQRLSAGGKKGGEKGAATRSKNAVSTEAVVRAARNLGWPDVTEKVNKKVAQSFPVSATRIGQILRNELLKK